MSASTSWRVLAFSRFCCSTMAATSCSGVSRKDHTSGASALSHAQISAMALSSMHPGPEGILATSPRADAPYLIARDASSTDLMQHTLRITGRALFEGVQLPRLVLASAPQGECSCMAEEVR